MPAEQVEIFKDTDSDIEMRQKNAAYSFNENISTISRVFQFQHIL